MKKRYEQLTPQERQQELERLTGRYRVLQRRGLQLDMSRGKPSREQLELSMPMLDAVSGSETMALEDGTDPRNYGLLAGLPQMRSLMGELLELPPEQVIVGGNSSLAMMFDTVAHAVTHGVLPGLKPWGRGVRFLCPAPGYDRHFGIAEHFGCQLIPIDLDGEGPDMEQVERWVNGDPQVKGMWCVPQYSNPTGITYSDRVVRRIAALQPAAPDFRVFWDNAYCVHHLYPERDRLLGIMEECAKRGNQDMVYLFASTSKITFPGAGVAALGASQGNIRELLRHRQVQTIGGDKLNQLRHLRFLRDGEGIRRQMERQAQLLRPKFQATLEVLERQLGPLGIGSWSKPRGGYFVSYNAPVGCAKRICQLCGEAGVKLTPPGSTYPGGMDPRDQNIRLAPTYPPVEELEQAMELFCLCAQIACLERLEAQRRAA